MSPGVYASAVVAARRQVAGSGDTVVDCTAGNGHDTVELARIVGLADGVGKLYCIDIQVTTRRDRSSRVSVRCLPLLPLLR